MIYLGRVVFKGVLNLGLMMVHFHYDFVLQGRRFGWEYYV
jgi:hypothetical protein